jgi:hypothetical protein
VPRAQKKGGAGRRDLHDARVGRGLHGSRVGFFWDYFDAIGLGGARSQAAGNEDWQESRRHAEH